MKRKIEVLVIACFLFSSLSLALSEDISLDGDEEGINFIQSYVSETVPGTTDDELDTLRTISSCYVLDNIETLGDCIESYEDEMPVQVEEVITEFNQEDGEDANVDVEDYLVLGDDSSVVSDEAGIESNLVIDLDISKQDSQDIGAQPTVNLLLDGDLVASETVDWDQDQIEFDADYMDYQGTDVEVGIELESGTAEDEDGTIFGWNRQSKTIGSVDISQCGPDHVWSEWNEECIETNDQISDRLDELDDSIWSVETEDNTVHTLDDFYVNSNEIMVHTGYKDGELADHGQTGWCGDMYFETDRLGSGYTTFTISMEELPNTQYGAEQVTQTPYIEIDGEKVFEEENGHISPEESIETTERIEDGETVRIGIEDRETGCQDYSKRTRTIIGFDTGTDITDSANLDDNGGFQEENGDLVLDDEGNTNAWAHWTDSINEGSKIVEIDFTIDDIGHARFELCGENCRDGSDGQIKEIIEINPEGEYGDDGLHNVNVVKGSRNGMEGALRDKRYTLTLEDTEDGVEYTIEGDISNPIWHEPDGSDDDKLSSSTDGISFEEFQIDTETGTEDDKPGIDMTINSVTISNQDEGSFEPENSGGYIQKAGESSCSSFGYSRSECPSSCDYTYAKGCH